MIGLTPKQRELYRFIAAIIAGGGSAPTVREMSDALKVSGSRIHVMLVALEERGYIRRLPHRARAIEIVAPAVTLNSEILTLTDRYAAAEGVSRDTAVNELLRQALGAAA